jgi:hypothetical protein
VAPFLPYALIGKFGDGGTYFYIGTGTSVVHSGPNARLFVRINDDKPGNGDGYFSVTITVERPIINFYVYDAKGDLVTNKITLDAEPEAKFAPHICLPCHGGVYDTTKNVVIGASFLPFDLDSFQYSETPAWTRSNQEEAFRIFNALVRATNPNPQNPHNPIVTLIDSWYPGGVNSVGSAWSESTPVGWSTHSILYHKFVAPLCRTCHMAQRKDVDWTSYDQFEAAKIGLQRELCTNHTMPHAQVPFEKLQSAVFLDGSLQQDFQALGITCVLRNSRP